MKKRLLCIVLCLALLATFLPAVAGASDLSFSDMPASTHWSYKALSAEQAKLADVDGNGSVSLTDASLIRRSILSTTARAYKALTW